MSKQDLAEEIFARNVDLKHPLLYRSVAQEAVRAANEFYKIYNRDLPNMEEVRKTCLSTYRLESISEAIFFVQKVFECDFFDAKELTELWIKEEEDKVYVPMHHPV